MSTATRITITAPVETVSALDERCAKSGSSRSSLIRQAIGEFLARKDEAAADQEYVSAYVRQPEDARMSEALTAAATASWDPWP